MNKEDLENRIQRASYRYGGSRAKRLLLHPYRTLSPVIARYIKNTKDITCRTYYGAEFHGVLPESVTTQVWRTSVYSPDVCRALHYVLKSGDTFVDIGAHFGFFSQLASYLVGPMGTVISVEAMPQTYGYLAKNMSRAAQENRAILFNNAAADRECKLVFKDYGIMASSLNTAFENRGVSYFAQEPINVDVRARKGDEIIRESSARPNLIKIDAESSELLVLSGLELTIDKFRPAVILELGDDPNNQSPTTPLIWSYMMKRGYEAVYFKGESPEKITLSAALRYANVLFLPK